MMDWLNPAGLILVILLLIPNIFYGLICKRDFQGQYHNKTMELMEQVGRFGCMAFMVLQLPFCRPAGRLYLILGGILMALYWLGWILPGRKNSIRRALALSTVPSALFLESGLLTGSWPLTALALVFACGHIAISCQNAK